jgi:hypothetical protein
VGRTFPIVSHGYLLSHARTIHQAGARSIFLTALATGLETSLPFWLPGAARIRVESADVTPAGQVLVAGSYQRSAAEDDGVNFVARVDRRGHVLAVHDLGGYTPERICAAEDGTYWTLGQEWALERQVAQREVQGGYALLRHYAASGVPKAQYFPRSSLPVGRVLNYHTHAPGAQWAFLRCGDASVGAYLGSGRASFLWTEVSPQTGETQHWRVHNLVGARITGLVLLAEHTAYASFGPAGVYRLEPASPRPAGRHRVGAFWPVPTQPARWAPLASDAADAGAPHGIAEASILLGRDGASLVHLSGTRSPRSEPVLHWSDPRR